MNGTYAPFVGDFDADGQDDIFWYDPTSGPDSIWFGGPVKERTASVSVTGAYRPVVGNFAGTTADDILWYRSGTATDSLWVSKGDGTFTRVAVSVSGTFRPVVADLVGDGHDDIYWLSGVAGGVDHLWQTRSGGGFTDSWHGPTVVGATPLTGRFRGFTQGVFLYVPGSAPDLLYTFPAGVWVHTAYSIAGTYTPAVGDFVGTHTADSCLFPDPVEMPGDSISDIAWYAPGRAPDALWQFAPDGSGAVTSRPLTANLVYTPLTLHLGSYTWVEGVDCGPWNRYDRLGWYSSSGGQLLDGVGHMTPVPTGAVPVVGEFDGPQGSSCSQHENDSWLASDVVLYRPGTASDRVVYDVGVSSAGLGC